jgi:hypothetical protein
MVEQGFFRFYRLLTRYLPLPFTIGLYLLAAPH